MKPIKREELKAIINLKNRDLDDTILLNVRSEEEFDVGHIPFSINMPVGTPGFAEKVAHLAGNKDRRIIVYCGGAECIASLEAIRKLEDAGFVNVLHYKGGMKEWTAAGYQVQDVQSMNVGRGPTGGTLPEGN